jgi:hypothetical protein
MVGLCEDFVGRLVQVKGWERAFQPSTNLRISRVRSRTEPVDGLFSMKRGDAEVTRASA